MGRTTIDLTGQKFGRLTVQVRIPRVPGESGQAKWLCLCDPALGGCGHTTIAGSNALRSGATQSCGCLLRDTLIARNTTHGLAPRSGRPAPGAYSSWCNMIRRCTHENDPRYPDWGGRGITIDPRWRDFRNFLADMGERPPGLTLERKDNDGPYASWNCIWATLTAQQQNTRARQVQGTPGNAADDTLLGTARLDALDQPHVGRDSLAGRVRKNPAPRGGGLNGRS